MATPIIMPRQGQSVESCILVEWLVPVGASVKTGQPVASIETDKAVFEIESPADGILVETFFTKGDDIPVLTNIAALGAVGEDVSSLRPSRTPSGAETVVDGGLRTPSQNLAPASVAFSASAPSPPTSSGISPRARHLAASRGVDPQPIPGTGPDGRVIARDIQSATAATHLSPAARQASAAGRLTAPAQGSGPGGLVLQADLTPAASAATPPTTPITGRTETRLTGIRKIIAERMRKSLANTAQLTLFRSFDATALLACRQQIKTEGEKRGLPNITLNDMLVHATARALVKHPDLNAHFLGDRIARFTSVNIGVATDAPRGLMVPVLRDVQALSLAEVSRQLKPLLSAAQAGTISPDHLQGGTFTITNMGMLGVEQFTPILNAPEVAILGVGGLGLKPILRDGEVQHVQSIVLSLTIDHQAVDGAPGARLLHELATSLETFTLASTENT